MQNPVQEQLAKPTPPNPVNLLVVISFLLGGCLSLWELLERLAALTCG